MLSLHTNSAALSAQNSVSRTQTSLSTSMTRLSTGFRINSAMDDAAGLQIATRLNAQSSGMAMAMRNTQNAISMMQTAEGALSETTNILVRMKDLATQAADAASTGADKTAMQSEYDALGAELANVVGNTSFGGAKLMSAKASATDVSNAGANAAGTLAAATTAAAAFTTLTNTLTTAQAAYASTPNSANATALANANAAFVTGQQLVNTTAAASAAAAAYSAVAAVSTASTIDGKLAVQMDFQIGASSAEKMGINLSGQLSTMHTQLGATSTNYNSFGGAIGATGVELTGAGSASAMIDKLSTAIDSVGAVRSSLGAASNRLEHVATNLSNVSTNTVAAKGRIMDVDFATESSNMTSSQMLLQAGTAMLKQSNSMSGMVMSLLQ